MKFKAFFLSAVAAIAALSACNKTEDPAAEGLEVDKTSVGFEIAGGEQTITLTTGMNWSLKGYTDDVKAWLSINPASGNGSAVVTVKAMENTGKDRSAVVTFYGNKANEAAVTFTQKGPKGDIEQITVQEFITKADTQTEYKLVGKVSNIADASYYGFDLTDATGTVSIAFPVNFKDFKEKMAVGGTATVVGVYQYYEQKGTHQMANGNIISYEEPEHKDAVKASVADFLKAADPATLYELKGTVDSFNSQYCSFNLNDGTGSIYVYSVDAASKTEFGSKVKDGSTVTLQGYYYVYQPKEGTPTVEIKDAKIISCEGGQEEDPSIWEKAEAKTVSAFITAAATDTYYKLTGTISDYVAANCRFTLTDASGSIQVYEVVNKADWASKMHEGGTVTISGKFKLYETTPEMVSGHILAYDASTEKPVEDLKHPLTSGITWTLGSQAYDNTSSGQSKQSATVNGKTVDNLLKLASSSKAGDATLTIPDGVTKIGLYVAGWEATTLAVGTENVSVPKTNGCTGNAPYTLTLSDEVNYVEVPVSGSSVKVSCSKRVLLIGINAVND